MCLTIEKDYPLQPMKTNNIIASRSNTYPFACLELCMYFVIHLPTSQILAAACHFSAPVTCMLGVATSIATTDLPEPVVEMNSSVEEIGNREGQSLENGP